MKALSDVQPLIRTVMNFCLSEYVVYVEMGAKQIIYLFFPHPPAPFFTGVGKGCAFLWRGFSSAAELNLGVFPGMSFEMNLSQPSKLRLRISKSWFYSFCQTFWLWFLAGDSYRCSGLSA